MRDYPASNKVFIIEHKHFLFKGFRSQIFIYITP